MFEGRNWCPGRSCFRQIDAPQNCYERAQKPGFHVTSLFSKGIENLPAIVAKAATPAASCGLQRQDLPETMDQGQPQFVGPIDLPAEFGTLTKGDAAPRGRARPGETPDSLGRAS